LPHAGQTEESTKAAAGLRRPWACVRWHSTAPAERKRLPHSGQFNSASTAARAGAGPAPRPAACTSAGAGAGGSAAGAIPPSQGTGGATTACTTSGAPAGPAATASQAARKAAGSAAARATKRSTRQSQAPGHCRHKLSHAAGPTKGDGREANLPRRTRCIKARSRIRVFLHSAPDDD